MRKQNEKPPNILYIISFVVCFCRITLITRLAYVSDRSSFFSRLHEFFAIFQTKCILISLPFSWNPKRQNEKKNAELMMYAFIILIIYVVIYTNRKITISVAYFNFLTSISQSVSSPGGHFAWIFFVRVISILMSR